MLSIEFARRTIPAEVRPTFQAMEAVCKKRSASPATDGAAKEGAPAAAPRLKPQLREPPPNLPGLSKKVPRSSSAREAASRRRLEGGL